MRESFPFEEPSLRASANGKNSGTDVFVKITLVAIEIIPIMHKGSNTIQFLIT